MPWGGAIVLMTAIKFAILMKTVEIRYTLAGVPRRERGNYIFLHVEGGGDLLMHAVSKGGYVCSNHIFPSHSPLLIDIK